MELWIGNRYDHINKRKIRVTDLWTDGIFLNKSG